MRSNPATINPKPKTNRYSFVSDASIIQKKGANVSSALRLSAASDCSPTVGLCLGPYGDPRGGGLILMSEVPLYAHRIPRCSTSASADWVSPIW